MMVAPTRTERVEIIARVIAWQHFDRKQWSGACTKEEWLRAETERSWKNFLPAAEAVITTMENGRWPG